MMKQSFDVEGAVIGIFSVTGIAAIVAAFAAYFTHLWWTISLLMTTAPVPAGRIVLAVAGMFFPPFGMLHGSYLWFNAW